MLDIGGVDVYERSFLECMNGSPETFITNSYYTHFVHCLYASIKKSNETDGASNSYEDMYVICADSVKDCSY
jgi:hypothetical protein